MGMPRGVGLLWTLGGLLLALLCSASAGKGEVLPRIWVVHSRALAPYAQAEAGLRQALPQTTIRSAVLGEDGRSPVQTLERLGAETPQVVVALGSTAARELRRLHPELPLVFSMVLDPVSSGLPSAGARSPDNLTGITMDVPPEAPLQALLEVMPGVRGLGVLTGAGQAEQIRARLQASGLLGKRALLLEPVRAERELPAVLERLLPRVDAVLALPDLVLYAESSLQFLLLQTLRQNRPLSGVQEPVVRAGALVGVALDFAALGRQTGRLVEKILSGADPASLAVEAPEQLTRMVNLRTARRLGLALEPQGLRRAVVVVP